VKGHVLILADGRSPTALSWVKNIQSLGYIVSLISSFHCERPGKVANFHVLPIALSRFSSSAPSSGSENQVKNTKGFIKRFAPSLQKVRYVLGPLSLMLFRKRYRRLVEEISPDIVHALRIPYEGMLASYTQDKFPLLVAIWGNDLTLHAKGSWLMAQFTKRCLSRANGLTSDAERDIHLARDLGLSQNAPALIVPGSGGLNLEAIQNTPGFNNRYGVPQNTTWVVNPRGLRPGSVHQDVFFEAIPEILKEKPNTTFICPNLKGQPQAEAWIEEFNINKQTFLLPKLPQSELWALFTESTLFISPSSHDGTPNTLLEAMACGCVPILGSIESLREWVEQASNGLLVDPHDPHDLARAVINALNDPGFINSAAQINKEIIKMRASQDVTLPRIDNFYTQFLK
jgi:glycosyltransferase involved in cell wall biosynthesis